MAFKENFSLKNLSVHSLPCVIIKMCGKVYNYLGTRQTFPETLETNSPNLCKDGVCNSYFALLPDITHLHFSSHFSYSNLQS